MKSIHYAAYGSNLHPVRLTARVPSAKLLECVRLPNFRLQFHKRSIDGSGKCNIVVAPGGVYVAVYEFAPSDKLILDKIEGLGWGYREARLDVPGIGSCFTYAAPASHIDGNLVPYGWYKTLVLLGCQYHKLPGDYISYVNAAPEQPDPDNARHEENMRLVDKIRNWT